MQKPDHPAMTGPAVFNGWGRGIRTPVTGTKNQGPAAGRYPNASTAQTRDRHSVAYLGAQCIAQTVEEADRQGLRIACGEHAVTGAILENIRLTDTYHIEAACH